MKIRFAKQAAAFHVLKKPVASDKRLFQLEQRALELEAVLRHRRGQTAVPV